MVQSRAIEKIEERLSGLQEGSLRYEALQAAKRFKVSWIELGRVLWTVSREKKFREWGYLTFEAYCAKEVGVRASTAKKLLHSYFFLEKEEPTVLKRLESDLPSRLPPVEAVNLLRLLKRRKELPEENYRSVREKLLEEGRELPEVRREVRFMLQREPADPAAAQAAHREKTVRRMIGTLKAIREEAEISHFLPKNLLSEVEALTKKLEAALQEG